MLEKRSIWAEISIALIILDEMKDFQEIAGRVVVGFSQTLVLWNASQRAFPKLQSTGYDQVPRSADDQETKL